MANRYHSQEMRALVIWVAKIHSPQIQNLGARAPGFDWEPQRKLISPVVSINTDYPRGTDAHSEKASLSRDESSSYLGC